MITIVVTVIIVVVAANAVVAVVNFIVANDVVTFIFTVGISNAGDIAVLILVAVNIVDAAFSCVANCWQCCVNFPVLYFDFAISVLLGLPVRNFF